MLVRLTAAAVAACLVVPSPKAQACDNGVEWSTDDYVRVLVAAEKAIEDGRYAKAKTALRMGFPASLKARAKNIEMIVALRTGDKRVDKNKMVDHFKARSEAAATKKDVRYRAWLAEAYILAGKPDDARPILLDLHTRDLMPDAYGYQALARLSTGTERYEYFKACLKRTENEDICTLPAEVKKTAQARR